ncbi:agenet domain-containing protein [Tanacetum coccineum]
MIREYKAIKEKEDPGVFVLPIRLKRRVDTHALADTDSNINIMPYRIFEELGREHIKPVSHNVSMLNHSKAKPMGMLKDVLCQIGVTTVIAKFLILDMPVDHTIPIIVRRSFLHTCGGIINILKGTTSTFDGVCHQKFYVSEIQNKGEESDSGDEEEYYLKRDEIGRPFYGPNLISYFDHNDPMERALAIPDSINPFEKIYVWKKSSSVSGSVYVLLLHTDWIPKGSGDFV